MAPFAQLWSTTLGRINITTHELSLAPGERPFCAQPYRAGPEKRKASEEEIEIMLELGFIEPAVSEWAVPVRQMKVLRRLPQASRLPRLDDYIDSLGSAE